MESIKYNHFANGSLNVPRKYHIVVFGATGATGESMVLEIVKYLESAPLDEQFTWAVAGRNLAKLEKVLSEVSLTLGKDLSGVDKIIAELEYAESLREMARQCDVVLNLVGPYLLYGEVVVKACVAEGTHHLDMSAEDVFLEEMQLKYHDDAKESGSLIIGATGFGSLPSDYGSIYLEENFNGELNSVESYMQFVSGIKLPEFHYGSYNSIMMMFYRYPELKLIRRKLHPSPYVDFKYKLGTKSIHYNKILKSWCLAVPVPDAPTMDRTQKYKFNELNRRPAQTQVYLQLTSLLVCILVWVAFNFLLTFGRFRRVYSLLIKYPRLFTLGMISHEKRRDGSIFTPFTFTLIGKGWNYRGDKSLGTYVQPPNKTVVLKISGVNAGHEGCVIPMLQAGVTIIKERGKMPPNGGVYTPGIAFAGTTLAKRLTQQGIVFSLDEFNEFDNDEKIV